MNKRFIAILSIVALTLPLSCQRENLFEQAVPQLVKVTSGADLAFKACGGEGDIEIEASDDPLIVSTAQDSWCHITVKDNKIHVVVDEHVGLESRYAELLLKSGDKNGKTIVHQYGIIVKSFNASDITLTNAAKEYVYEYDANETLLQAESDVDWVKIEVTPSTLKINVDENPDVQQSREGHISWNFGKKKGIITVFQFDPEAAGMLGDWTIKFYQNKTAKITVTGTLAAAGEGKYKLTVADTKTGLNFDFETAFNKMDLMLPLGVKWGTYVTKTATYSLFALMHSSNSYLAYGTSVNTGFFPISMEQNATGIWKGLGETDANTGLFHLEGWTDDEHEGVSAVSLWYSSIQMQKK